MESSELECPWSAGGIDLCLVGAIYTRFPKYGAIYTSTPNRLIYGGRGIDHCISWTEQQWKAVASEPDCAQTSDDPRAGKSLQLEDGFVETVC